MYAILNDEKLNTRIPEEIFKTNPKIGLLPYQTIDFDNFLSLATGPGFVFHTAWLELLDELKAGNIDMVFCTESSVASA